MPEQPELSSTADYCSNSSGKTHYMATHMRGGALVSVSRCTFCDWIDFDDLDEQVRALVAEGRRQATEGLEREWALNGRGWSGFRPFTDEAQYRAHAAVNPEVTAVSRLVGPWEAAEVSASDDPASDHRQGSAG